MAKRILCISYDASLLQTRKMLLEKAGFDVVTAEGFVRAMSICAADGAAFDLVILGHSIAREDKERLISHIRATCGAPVLALLRGLESPVPGAVRSIPSLEPIEFLNAVREMLEHA